MVLVFNSSLLAGFVGVMEGGGDGIGTMIEILKFIQTFQLSHDQTLTGPWLGFTWIVSSQMLLLLLLLLLLGYLSLSLILWLAWPGLQ